MTMNKLVEAATRAAENQSRQALQKEKAQVKKILDGFIKDDKERAKVDKLINDLRARGPGGMHE